MDRRAWWRLPAGALVVVLLLPLAACEESSEERSAPEAPAEPAAEPTAPVPGAAPTAAHTEVDTCELGESFEVGAFEDRGEVTVAAADDGFIVAWAAAVDRLTLRRVPASGEPGEPVTIDMPRARRVTGIHRLGERRVLHSFGECAGAPRCSVYQQVDEDLSAVGEPLTISRHTTSHVAHASSAEHLYVTDRWIRRQARDATVARLRSTDQGLAAEPVEAPPCDPVGVAVRAEQLYLLLAPLDPTAPSASCAPLVVWGAGGAEQTLDGPVDKWRSSLHATEDALFVRSEAEHVSVPRVWRLDTELTRVDGPALEGMTSRPAGGRTEVRDRRHHPLRRVDATGAEVGDGWALPVARSGTAAAGSDTEGLVAFVRRIEGEHRVMARRLRCPPIAARSAPVAPRLTRRANTRLDQTARFVATGDGRILVAGQGRRGWQVAQITPDGTELRRDGDALLGPADDVTGLAVAGDDALVTLRRQGLAHVQLSDEMPQLAAVGFGAEHHHISLARHGDRAYVVARATEADQASLLVAFDVSAAGTTPRIEIDQVRELGRLETEEDLGAIAALDGLVVAAVGQTLRVFDVSDPDAMAPRGALELGAAAFRGVAWSPGRVVWSTRRDVLVVDVSDPDAPRIVARAGRSFTSVFPAGDRVYALEPCGSVLALDLQGDRLVPRAATVCALTPGDFAQGLDARAYQLGAIDERIVRAGGRTIDVFDISEP